MELSLISFLYVSLYLTDCTSLNKAKRNAYHLSVQQATYSHHYQQGQSILLQYSGTHLKQYWSISQQQKKGLMRPPCLDISKSLFSFSLIFKDFTYLFGKKGWGKARSRGKESQADSLLNGEPSRGLPSHDPEVTT